MPLLSLLFEVILMVNLAFSAYLSWYEMALGMISLKNISDLKGNLTDSLGIVKAF